MSVEKCCCCGTAGAAMLGLSLVLGLAVALPLGLKKAKYQNLFQQELLQQMATQTPNPMLLQALKGKVRVYAGACAGAAVLTVIPLALGLGCCEIACDPRFN